jgi:hypothetical protein
MAPNLTKIKLTPHFNKHPKLKKLFLICKKKFQSANLHLHNLDHTLRVTYRSLVIAKSYKKVNYLILISSCLLHDIGISLKGIKDHQQTGVKFASQQLPRLGYSHKEISAINHCIKEHGDHPQSLEGKILFDADTLEKSSSLAAFLGPYLQLETQTPLKQFIPKVLPVLTKLPTRGFYTQKAREIDNGGLQRCLDIWKLFVQDLKSRPDFTITEKDLL